jgi:hypothetical protein
MSTAVHPDLIRLFEQGTPIDEALIKAVRAAVGRHRREGNAVVEWRDGRVVWVPPEDIPDQDTPGPAPRP